MNEGNSEIIVVDVSKKTIESRMGDEQLILSERESQYIRKGKLYNALEDEEKYSEE